MARKILAVIKKIKLEINIVSALLGWHGSFTFCLCPTSQGLLASEKRRENGGYSTMSPSLFPQGALSLGSRL